MTVFLFIFFVFCLAETGYLFYKWQEAKNIYSVIRMVSEVADFGNFAPNNLMRFAVYLVRLKKFIWIAVALILLLNIILTAILTLVIAICHLTYLALI